MYLHVSGMNLAWNSTERETSSFYAQNLHYCAHLHAWILMWAWLTELSGFAFDFCWQVLQVFLAHCEESYWPNFVHYTRSASVHTCDPVCSSPWTVLPDVQQDAWWYTKVIISIHFRIPGIWDCNNKITLGLFQVEFWVWLHIMQQPLVTIVYDFALTTLWPHPWINTILVPVCSKLICADCVWNVFVSSNVNFKSCPLSSSSLSTECCLLLMAVLVYQCFLHWQSSFSCPLSWPLNEETPCLCSWRCKWQPMQQNWQQCRLLHHKIHTDMMSFSIKSRISRVSHVIQNITNL